MDVSLLYYANGYVMEGFSCYELVWTTVQEHSILVRKVGAWNQKWHNLCECQGVVTVVDDEFQTKSCLTISYTNGEILEGLMSCCELS